MNHSSGQRKRSKVTVQPGKEPVTLIELKKQVSVNDSTSDTVLKSLISSSRVMLEKFTDRKFIQQEITMFMDSFGNTAREEIWEGIAVGPRSAIRGRSQFELEYAPAISLTKISTFDREDNETIVDPLTFRFDNFDADMAQRVTLKQESVWPLDLRDSSAIKVVYLAGYGPTKDDVPSLIRQGILLIGAFMFRNRGDCPAEAGILEGSGAAAILNTYKRMKV